MRPYYFSEFSYGFAVTAEFVRDPALRIIDPPEFPSLRREGQAGGGADVRLNMPGVLTYLQFKLSDYMWGPTAAERNLFPSRGYYRFHIRNDVTASGMTQHELLIQLDRPGNEVYYIAPGFYYEPDWQRLYRCRQVVHNSIMFSPAVLGPVDNTEDHVVAFETAGAGFGWLCSEPIRREATPGETALRHLKILAKQAEPITIDWLADEVQKLARILEISPPDPVTVRPEIADERRLDRETIHGIQLATQLASMARSHLDCTLAVVNP
jgi:hypothetical protein